MLSAESYFPKNSLHITCSSLIVLFSWLSQSSWGSYYQESSSFHSNISRVQWRVLHLSLSNYLKLMWTALISIPNFCPLIFISIPTFWNWFTLWAFFLLCFVCKWELEFKFNQICTHHPLAASVITLSTEIHARTLPLKRFPQFLLTELFINLPGIWKIHKIEKELFMGLGSWTSLWKKVVQPYLRPYTKINSRPIKDLNMKSKISRESDRILSSWHILRTDFLNES